MNLNQVLLLSFITLLNIILIIISFIIIFKKQNALSFKNMIPGLASKKLLDLAGITGIKSYVFIALEFTIISLLLRIFYHNFRLYFSIGSFNQVAYINSINSDYLIVTFLFIPFAIFYIYMMNILRKKFYKNNENITLGKFIILLLLDIYVYNTLIMYYAFNGYTIEKNKALK